MPRYSYRCNDCGVVFDVALPLGKEADKCSVCDSANISKVVPEFQSTFANKKKSIAGDNIRRYIEDNRRAKEGVGQDFQKLEKDFRK